MRAGAIVLSAVGSLPLLALAIALIVQSDELVRAAREFQLDGEIVPPAQQPATWAMLGAGVLGLAGTAAVLVRRLTVAAVGLGIIAVVTFLVAPPFVFPRLASLCLAAAAVLAGLAQRRASQRIHDAP